MRLVNSPRYYSRDEYYEVSCNAVLAGNLFSRPMGRGGGGTGRTTDERDDDNDDEDGCRWLPTSRGPLTSRLQIGT